MELLQELIDSKKQFDFNQGLDIRLVDKTIAKMLRKLKIWKQLRFALDDPKLISLIKNRLELLNEVGFKNKEFRFYVLIGFNTTPKEDLKRVNFLYEKGCDIFIMPYDKFNEYQKKFARWVNRFFYKYISFKDYCNEVRKNV